MYGFIYDILLVMMLFVLYQSGKHILETGKIVSTAGLVAIFAYTFNEGLRYGRGIDYNLYAMRYEDLAAGKEIDWEAGYMLIAKALIAMDIPWQGFVILMSAIFIIATIFLLKQFDEVFPIALPLFVLFSIPETENRVRWYTGFAFVMIGLAYLLSNDEKRIKKFIIFSLLSLLFHLALLPFPILFYLIYLKKSPILSPIPIILLFVGLAFFFQTDFMLNFIMLIQILGVASGRFEGYADNAEYWLEGGIASTVQRQAFPGMQYFLFYAAIIYMGYKVVKELDRKFIFAYNMYALGFLAYPIARQMELVTRFVQPFMFFMGIVLACIIEYVYIQKKELVNQTIVIFSLLIFLNYGRKQLVTPLNNEPQKYLYIWDSNGRSYHSMYDMWIYDMYETGAKNRKKNVGRD